MTGRDLVMFLFGGGAGAALTYFLMKDKVQKELDILHDEFKERTEKEELKKEEEAPKIKQDDEDILQAAKVLAKERYEYKTDPDLNVSVPHVIPLDEFATLDGYGTRSLTYYEDGVVTDENDDPIDEPSKIIGDDYISRFKVADADVVYVRNDLLENDYEIVRCPDPYSYDDVDEMLEDHHLKKGIDYDDEEENEEY